MIDKIIVGLGNPGRKYQSNRHNLGFIIIDAFRELRQAPKFKKVKNGQWEEANFTLDNQSILLVKPLAYMNRSGWAIEELIELYPNISPKELLVIVDDVNLDAGKLKLRAKGSAGGHNGLKDIIDVIGEDFARLRIGCGPLPQDIELTDYVLDDLTAEEKIMLPKVITTACEAILSWLKHPIDTAMNLINQSNINDVQGHNTSIAVNNARSKE